MLKNYSIILASGKGSRYKSDIPKQFIEICGKTILEYTIDVFEKSEQIDNIIIVITPGYKQKAEEIISRNNYKKIIKVVNGGEIRKESSYIGVSVIEDKEANVLIHDCARPFVTSKIVYDCIKALENYKAVGVAIPTSDTIIEVKDNIIENIPDRKSLMRVQTPQCFKLSLIKKAHDLSKNDNNFTDDCGLIVRHNLAPVYIVDGSMENIKITYPSDIYLAENLLKNKNL